MLFRIGDCIIKNRCISELWVLYGTPPLMMWSHIKKSKRAAFVIWIVCKFFVSRILSFAFKSSCTPYGLPLLKVLMDFLQTTKLDVQPDCLSFAQNSISFMLAAYAVLAYFPISEKCAYMYILSTIPFVLSCQNVFCKVIQSLKLIFHIWERGG